MIRLLIGPPLREFSKNAREQSKFSKNKFPAHYDCLFSDRSFNDLIYRVSQKPLHIWGGIFRGWFWVKIFTGAFWSNAPLLKYWKVFKLNGRKIRCFPHPLRNRKSMNYRIHGSQFHRTSMIWSNVINIKIKKQKALLKKQHDMVFLSWINITPVWILQKI